MPRCAFESGTFDSDNWMCGTLIALRDLGEEKRAYNSDHSALVLSGPEDSCSFILLYWYKNRGRTESALVWDGQTPTPLTLAEAEAALHPGRQAHPQ